MRFPGSNTLGLAFSSLFERPLRTFLTMLGIIFGVAAVYATLSIGEGAKQKILENIDSVEARTISVYPDWSQRRASSRRPWRPFSEDDVIRIQSISGVVAATGDLNNEYTLVTETNDWLAEVRGIDTQYLTASDLTMGYGDAITQAHIDRKDPVAVIGSSVVRSLFNGQYPIGERIKIQNIPFTVIGVVENTDAQNWRGRDNNNFVLVPRSTLRARLMGDNYLVRQQVRGVVIVGESQGALPRIEQELDYILRQTRGLSPIDAPDFRIFNFSANRQAFAQTQRTLSMLLATLGIVSLVVACVGIMNIMLVSVAERTREIGLRMAIGAYRSDVMKQILTEALVLSSIAGLLGLALGFSTSQISLGTDDVEMVFSYTNALLAFGSALFVGLISGIWPAYRAASLNPVEALRHE